MLCFCSVVVSDFRVTRFGTDTDIKKPKELPIPKILTTIWNCLGISTPFPNWVHHTLKLWLYFIPFLHGCYLYWTNQLLVFCSLSKNKNEIRRYLLFFPWSFHSSIACFEKSVIIFQLLDWVLVWEARSWLPWCYFWPGYTLKSEQTEGVREREG